MVTTTATTRRPARADETDGIDETSERWATSIHEAAHAVVAEYYGGTVLFCRVTGAETGLTRHTATGLRHAVVAVAGERATRLLCGTGGGSATDYRQAREQLHGTGRDLAWAEHHADHAVTTNRREIRQLATRLYRKGRR